MARAAVLFCGSLTCLIEQPARASEGSVRAGSGLHPPKWAPTHGPPSRAPCGWTPDRWVGEGTPGHLKPGHSAWYPVEAVHFSCLIRIFYSLQGWGGWAVAGRGVIHGLPLQGVTDVFVCMHAPGTPSSPRAPQVIASIRWALTVSQACVIHIYDLIYSI